MVSDSGVRVWGLALYAGGWKKPEASHHLYSSCSTTCGRGWGLGFPWFVIRNSGFEFRVSCSAFGLIRSWGRIQGENVHDPKNFLGIRG